MDSKTDLDLGAPQPGELNPENPPAPVEDPDFREVDEPLPAAVQPIEQDPETLKHEAEEQKIDALMHDDAITGSITLTKGSNTANGPINPRSGDGLREVALKLAEQIEAGHQIDLTNPSNTCAKCGARAWQVQDGIACVPKPA